MEEIEGLQYSLETGTHLISLVEKEEVCMFDCFFFSVVYNMNSIYVALNLFVFFILKDTTWILEDTGKTNGDVYTSNHKVGRHFV